MIEPLRMYGAAALALASLASGCGTQPSPPGAEHRPSAPPPPPPPPRAPRPVPPPVVTTTATLVDAAFGGRAPAFPLLASTGNEVAVGIASPIGGGTIATYRVVTFSNWTNLSDAWGSTTLDYPIVDTTMTTMLLDHATGEPAPSPDPRTLAERATVVSQRLRIGGFTPFDGAFATFASTDTDTDTAIGPVKLRTTHGPEAELTIHLLDAGDRELAANTLKPRVMGLVADLACVSTPAARRAWLDARRHRVLVEIGWNAGGDGCPTPDPEYGMWPTP
jgi:hypothetical protein